MSANRPRKVGIALPCQDQVDSWFMHDLFRAGAYHAFAFPQDELILSMHQSAFLAESRNELCKGLIEQGADYVIFLDTDMRFPQNVFDQLMQHDLPVVAANCAKRRRPISATARKEDPTNPAKLDMVWPDKEKQGIEKIAVVGTAVMCIKAEVFFELEYPWFHTPWHPEDQRFVGEDLYFCAQLKKAGVGLYIDHGLSWHIGHIGQYTYRMDDVLAEREMARIGMWDHLKPPQAETTNGREPLIVAAR